MSQFSLGLADQDIQVLHPKKRSYGPWGRSQGRVPGTEGQDHSADLQQGKSSPESFRQLPSTSSVLLCQVAFLILFSSLGPLVQFSKEIATFQRVNWREVYASYSRPTSKQPIDLMEHKQHNYLLPFPKLASVFNSVGHTISSISYVYRI